ncbi:oligoendopeptidase F, partial [Bacillus cereus]
MNSMIDHPTKWDLKRLYSEEQDPMLPTEIEKLIETYKENRDPAILSNIIQSIEKAEYYFYCLSTEQVDESILALPHTKIMNLKRDVRLLLQEESNVSDNASIHFIENELQAWEDMYI